MRDRRPWDSSPVTTTAPHKVQPPDGEELAQFLLDRLTEHETYAQRAADAAGAGGWLGHADSPDTITLYANATTAPPFDDGDDSAGGDTAATGRWPLGRRLAHLDGADPRAITRHVIENAPYFVGVDCRATRAIVHLWLTARDRGDTDQTDTLLPVLLQLAARYHQHEDFRRQLPGSSGDASPEFCPTAGASARGDGRSVRPSRRKDRPAQSATKVPAHRWCGCRRATRGGGQWQVDRRARSSPRAATPDRAWY